MLYAFLAFCGVILALMVAILLFLYYYLRTAVWCRSQTCLVDKTALVTGANTGIGYETALDFAKRGARVILACRNEEKAQAARTRIIEVTGNENIVVRIINLASFESVRAFAKEINNTESRLDILVNNAGAGDLLKKSAPSRIVNVSSIAAKYARFELKDLDAFVGVYRTYANSKLCNIWFTLELAKKLEGTGVTAYSVHPGAVRTEIFRRMEAQIFFDFIKDNFFKTSEEGAQTSIYTAVAKGIEQHNGEHFDNCEVVERYKTADYPGLHRELWKKTVEMVQLKPEEIQV